MTDPLPLHPSSLHPPCARRALVVASSLLAMVMAVAVAQVERRPAPDAIAIRVVDERGQPFAAGTVILANVWGFPDPAAPAFWAPSGLAPPMSKLEVGRDGSVLYARGPRAAGAIEWLRLQRATADARGERALVNLHALPERVVLVREQRLAGGALTDATGAPVPQHAVGLGVAGDDGSGVPVEYLLEPRWRIEDGAYELWGWRADGEFWLTATYLHFGPDAPRLPLPAGAAPLTITLPATGHVQVKLQTPKPFPEHGAVFAVLRDLDRGGVRRQYLIANDATNIRTLLGRFAVTIELNGVVVRDCGTLTVAHDQTTSVTHDLRPTVRLFRIDVVDPDGKPDPLARVRVAGSPDEPMSWQSVEFDGVRRFGFVVATTLERVDLEVSRFGGTQSRIVKDVAGDRVVELPAERR